MSFGFQNNNLSHTNFQFLEDLSTAYWYSQVLFTAIELELFDFIDKGLCSLEEIAQAASCDSEKLYRLLRAMERIGLIINYKGNFYNSQIASFFLVSRKKEYLGDFLLYRQYIRPQWEKLSCKISSKDKKSYSPNPSHEELSYEKRTFLYVAAMDSLIKQKAREIAELLKFENIKGKILDIGGGAGSLIRAIQNTTKNHHALLFDLPEVIEAAKKIYPKKDDWKGIQLKGGEFGTYSFKDRFGLVCLSNFLHAYGHDEARELFFKASSLLDRDGIILIHDYFPDRNGIEPEKGALYDLNMMLNTFNGKCHDSSTIIQWCKEAGFSTIAAKNLSTDTGIIIATQRGEIALTQDPLYNFAMELGVKDMIPIIPEDIVTSIWVREKCRFGCEHFGRGLQCPPNGMDHEKTRQLLDSYTSAFLIIGTPPGKNFYNLLLELEKKAFLAGFHKAFVLGAGPCVICNKCPENGLCRHPDIARPCMEGSGIDVYSTAANAGIILKPVQEKGQYVTYIGLLLVE